MNCTLCNDTGRVAITEPSGCTVGHACPNGCWEAIMKAHVAGKDYEQVMREWGARFTGGSLVQPWTYDTRTQLVGGGN